MKNEPKTPGEVAYAKYIATMPGNWDGDWSTVTGSRREAAWEAAAQAVRKQVGEEIHGDLLEAPDDDELMQTLSDIRAVLAEWSSNPAKVMSKWVYFSANDVIEAIGDLLAEPKPEEAEACAEDAGAEPSKSPPPAKR